MTWVSAVKCAKLVFTMGSTTRSRNTLPSMLVLRSMLCSGFWRSTRSSPHGDEDIRLDLVVSTGAGTWPVHVPIYGTTCTDPYTHVSAMVMQFFSTQDTCVRPSSRHAVGKEQLHQPHVICPLLDLFSKELQSHTSTLSLLLPWVAALAPCHHSVRRSDPHDVSWREDGEDGEEGGATFWPSVPRVLSAAWHRWQSA